MNKKMSIILGIYDLILALGALYSGLLMINPKNAIFSEYTVQFPLNLSFSNWTFPGIIVILVFGLGNVIAAVFCFKKNTKHAWFASAITGVLFLTCVICQILIMGKFYLPTAEFFIFSIVQLCLSGISLSLS